MHAGQNPLSLAGICCACLAQAFQHPDHATPLSSHYRFTLERAGTGSYEWWVSACMCCRARVRVCWWACVCGDEPGNLVTVCSLCGHCQRFVMRFHGVHATRASLSFCTLFSCGLSATSCCGCLLEQPNSYSGPWRARLMLTVWQKGVGFNAVGIEAHRTRSMCVVPECVSNGLERCRPKPLVQCDNAYASACSASL